MTGAGGKGWEGEPLDKGAVLKEEPMRSLHQPFV